MIPMTRSLMSESEIDRYARDLETKSDKDLVEETSDCIYNAASQSLHSSYDQQAMACYKEAKRRGKPSLYQRGYNMASRDAGAPVSDSDLERASPKFYEERNAA